MTKTFSNITILFIFLLIFSCNRTMTYEEMFKYINNPQNGLTQEKEIDGTKIKLTYRPSQMMAYQELKQKHNVSKNEIKNINTKYAKQYYLVLSFSFGDRDILSNPRTRQDLEYYINEFSFNMLNNVYLISSQNDTLGAIDSQFPRYFGLTNQTDVLLVFEKEQKNYDQLILYIKEFGLQTGDIKFKFKPDKFSKKIRYENI